MDRRFGRSSAKPLQARISLLHRFSLFYSFSVYNFGRVAKTGPPSSLGIMNPTLIPIARLLLSHGSSLPYAGDVAPMEPMQCSFQYPRILKRHTGINISKKSNVRMPLVHWSKAV